MQVLCEHCGSEFTLIKGHGGQNRSYCYTCIPEGLDKQVRTRLHQDLRRERSHKMKLELGCKVCGYAKCAVALEWHHPEDDKKHDPSNAIKRSWSAYLKETEKCILLCANCHREVHAGLIQI